MANEAYMQVAPDSSGKRVANFAVALPVGTAVTDGDGVVTYLAAETTVFLQRVVLTDSDGEPVDFKDKGQDAIVLMLTNIYELLQLTLQHSFKGM